MVKSCISSSEMLMAWIGGIRSTQQYCVTESSKIATQEKPGGHDSYFALCYRL